MNNYIIIAHRGITEIYNDNSLSSLLEIKKIKTNFKLGIEFDIQITKDNKIILYHDEFVMSGRVNDYTFFEIKKYNNNIIKLEELLNEFNNTEYLLDIEIKCYNSNDIINNINLVIDLVDKYNINYFYSSFSFDIVKKIKEKEKVIYFISEDLEDKNVDITSYKSIDNFHNVKGVYTLYDNNFDESNIRKMLDNKINYFITDDVEKTINYLSFITN